MNSTTEQLTEAERVAIHHAANYCTADGHYETAEELRKLLARLRPKPSLPERVYVRIGPEQMHDAAAGATLPVKCSGRVFIDDCFTILPEFPDGLDTIAKLAVEDGLTIERGPNVFRVYQRNAALYIADGDGNVLEFPTTLDGFYSALRAALTYANRKA